MRSEVYLTGRSFGFPQMLLFGRGVVVGDPKHGDSLFVRVCLPFGRSRGKDLVPEEADGLLAVREGIRVPIGGRGEWGQGGVVN